MQSNLDASNPNAICLSSPRQEEPEISSAPFRVIITPDVEAAIGDALAASFDLFSWDAKYAARVVVQAIFDTTRKTK